MFYRKMLICWVNILFLSSVITSVANQPISPREEKSNAVASIKQIGLTKLRFVPRNEKKSNIFVGTVRPEGFLLSVPWGELSYCGNYFFEFIFLP
jgi:hypothetical protein